VHSRESTCAVQLLHNDGSGNAASAMILVIWSDGWASEDLRRVVIAYEVETGVLAMPEDVIDATAHLSRPMRAVKARELRLIFIPLFPI
jgi:hypothetical protein